MTTEWKDVIDDDITFERLGEVINGVSRTGFTPEQIEQTLETADQATTKLGVIEQGYRTQPEDNINLINPIKVTQGEYIDGNGNPNSNAVYAHSEKIAVVAGETYSGVKVGDNTTNVFRFATFFDVAGDTTGSVSAWHSEFTTPANTVAVIVSFYSIVADGQAVNELDPVDICLRLTSGGTSFVVYDYLEYLQVTAGTVLDFEDDNAIATKGNISSLVAESVSDALAFKASVSFGGDDEITTISGSLSTRNVLPFKSKQIFESRQFNYESDLVGETVIRSNIKDDIPPIHAYHTTLLSNHSYRGCRYVVSGHGKTIADIGSLYSNGGNQFVLISVDGDTLAVMDTVLNSDTYPSSGDLVYVSGGVTTNNITAAGKWYRDVYPCAQNHSIDILIDGVSFTGNTGDIGYNESLVFNETYELLAREDIIAWYVSGGDNSLNPTGPAKVYHSNSYRYDFEGSCTISSDYSFDAGVFTQDILGLQAVVDDALDSYYIPKTVAFDYEGTSRNFSMLEPSTLCTDESSATIYFTAEKLDASEIPNDRWLQIGSVGVFAMGFLPLGSAGVNRAANIGVRQTVEIRGNTNKMYPRLVDKGTFTSVQGDSFGMVGYRNVHVPFAGATATYPVRTQGDDYYFIDYHDTAGMVSLPMPDDYIGREFEIVESRNITVNSVVISNKFNFVVDCVGDYGYLVIKVKA